MHNFTHEYKMVNVKDDHGRPTGEKRPSYVGSRCRSHACPENRRRAVLAQVKSHNDTTHEFFGTTGNTKVVKD